ncbi:MAG: SDR family oxidoreductase [Eubacteriaceae bacterium]|nr:SDR family oxidoreductase [Eubacteriaceae bacterium]
MKKRTIFAASIAGAASVMYVLNKTKDAINYSVHGQTALITGASGGLGLEFAKEFASHGFDVVLTARSKDKLEKASEYITEKYGVRATVITSDLSERDGAQKLYEEVIAAGIHIDQMVNNAGAGRNGKVIDAEPDMMKDLIDLNVTSVTMLCHLFGKDMAKRGKGKILNVSSLGAFIPDPYFNVYGPTKAYELFLSQAMYGELAGSGVTVSVICPGPTKTNWAANAGKADSSIALDPEKVAGIGYKGLQKGELVIIPTLVFKAEKAFMSMLPPKVRTMFISKWQQGLIKSR